MSPVFGRTELAHQAGFGIEDQVEDLNRDDSSLSVSGSDESSESSDYRTSQDVELKGPLNEVLRMRASRSFDEFTQRKKQETVNFHTSIDYVDAV